MIRISRVALRYGNSLFDAAQSGQKLEQVNSDLMQLETLVNTSSDFASVITNPTIARNNLEKCFSDISSKMKFNKLTANLLCLLAQRRRAYLIPELVKHYRTRLHSQNNQLLVDVIAHCDLTAKQKTNIQKAVEKQTGKQIILNVNIDESIMGGIIVNYGSNKLDFSLKRKLNELKHELERLG